jgi:hypothetical protein
MFQSLLVKLATALERAGIPYMVIGGQAVLQYGEPRLTRDIDITLGADLDKLSLVRTVTKSVGLEEALDDVEDFVRRTNVLPVHDKESGIRIDLIFSFSPYERQAIQRSVPINVGDNTVQYATVEDVIIHKIIAGRPRDLEDVRGILIRNRNCDSNYIERWLRAFGQTLKKNFVRELKDIQNE